MGPVEAKAMFGGYGIFMDGLMFGLVADDTLYLKVDAENQPDFEQLGLPPFRYSKNGKTFNMSYYQAPEEVLDAPAPLCDWGKGALAAAIRAAQKKKRR